jgi:hypothetical protein
MTAPSWRRPSERAGINGRARAPKAIALHSGTKIRRARLVAEILQCAFQVGAGQPLALDHLGKPEEAKRRAKAPGSF